MKDLLANLIIIPLILVVTLTGSHLHLNPLFPLEILSNELREQRGTK